jgi:Ni/Co efflux regulator RcnB
MLFNFMKAHSKSLPGEEVMKQLLSLIVLSGILVASTFSAQAAARIAQRKENQQDRIAQGVKSGQLTAGETAHLENKESAVNKEVRAERTLNGGKLTPAERTQVNRQQNRLSKQIYTDKHNAAQQ